MPRLLFVVNVDWFFLSHRLPVALAARDAGFEVHVATVVTGSARDIESHGFKLHPIALDRRSANPLDAIRLLWALRQLMRHLRPDVVHLVTIKPVLLGGLAARLAGVRRVVAAISGLGYTFTAIGLVANLRRWLVSCLYSLALAHQNVRVIFQNADDQAVLQKHTGIGDAQAVLIRGSGVDLRMWMAPPLPAGAQVVMMVSRLLVDKGVREFIDAARILRGREDVRFVLVGDVDHGNPSSFSCEDMQRFVKDRVVEWWGPQDNMPEVFAVAHLVVLPSYREGLPKVLIEAAASARAVVTTDVPGCRDAIIEGRTGLLVPPRDAHALANAIEALLKDPGRLRDFGHAGRKLAEDVFDVREVIAKHLEIYFDGTGRIA